MADVTNPQECEQVVAKTVERFGEVNVLVNNAGCGMKYINPDFLTERTRFWEADPKAWKMVVDTNVNGPFFIARVVVPRMLEQDGESINVSMNYETMKRRGFERY